MPDEVDDTLADNRGLCALLATHDSHPAQRQAQTHWSHTLSSRLSGAHSAAILASIGTLGVASCQMRISCPTCQQRQGSVHIGAHPILVVDRIGSDGLAIAPGVSNFTHQHQCGGPLGALPFLPATLAGVQEARCLRCLPEPKPPGVLRPACDRPQYKGGRELEVGPDPCTIAPMA